MSDQKQILRKVQKPERGSPENHPDFIFFCPGCKCGHGIWLSRWSWNGSLDKPTFQPSLKIEQVVGVPPVTPENLEEWKRNPWTQTSKHLCCHSFIANGMIQFLNDCTHSLAGKTVPMEAF